MLFAFAYLKSLTDFNTDSLFNGSSCYKLIFVFFCAVNQVNTDAE